MQVESGVHFSEKKSRVSNAEYLLQLANEQRRAIASGEVEILTSSKKEILPQFKRTRAFRKLYGDLANRALLPISDEGINELRQEFSGGAFQEMAFAVMSSQVDESSVVLDHRRTLDFYQKLYPKSEKIFGRFGETTLQGIHVPDGLIVSREGKIKGICEYTLFGGLAYLLAKAVGQNRAINDFPGIFSESDLIFVTPRPDSPDYKFMRAQRKELPFSYRQFRFFMDQVFDGEGLDMVDDDVAAVSDLVSEGRYQLARERRKRTSGDLTPEGRRYILRVEAFGSPEKSY